jgi:hypothetical protein
MLTLNYLQPMLQKIYNTLPAWLAGSGQKDTVQR